VRIEATPEGLTAALPSGSARLYAESKTSFAVRTQDARVDFQHDSKGRVTGVVGPPEEVAEAVPWRNPGVHDRPVDEEVVARGKDCLVG